MIYIIIGSLAFILFLVFDINKIKYFYKPLNFCFAAGLLILTICTSNILFGNYEGRQVSYLWKIIWSFMAFLTLMLGFSSLFLFIPFKRTYTEVEQSKVITTGAYGLCRHPGVFCFILFYLFLWLASGKTMMLWAGIIWNTMNVLYVYVQDKWIFPKMLIGYEHYQATVPFLIPNKDSIKKFIDTI